MTLRNSSQKRERFNHNRKRNTGLIYEFLVRQLARQMIDKDQSGWKKTYGVIEKYFSPGSLLAEELEMFDALRSVRNLKEIAARRLISEVYSRARKMDEHKLDIKKSNLIKDVNYSFGKDFFSKHRVAEYRLLASIQMLIDNCRLPGRLAEDVQKIQLEESLVSYLTSGPEESKDKKTEDRIDSMVYKVASQKFTDRYGQVLNESQRALLDRFGRALLTKQPKVVREQLLGEKARILGVLRGSRTLKEIRDDSIMAKGLEEAISKLVVLDENSEPESAVEEMILYERLAEELNRDV
jgi:hypothetical protein